MSKRSEMLPWCGPRGFSWECSHLLLDIISTLEVSGVSDCLVAAVLSTKFQDPDIPGGQPCVQRPAGAPGVRRRGRHLHLHDQARVGGPRPRCRGPRLHHLAVNNCESQNKDSVLETHFSIYLQGVEGRGEPGLGDVHGGGALHGQRLYHRNQQVLHKGGQQSGGMTQMFKV